MKSLKWINTGALAAMIGVNAMAEMLPIGGKTTGQISEAYPNLFTPAPFTFAVWGLIYLLMICFVIYQHGFPDGEEAAAKVRHAVGPWFTVSCALNILWIFLWHYRLIGLSAVCIIALLIVLNMITARLRATEGTLLMRATVKGGFSLYNGWIIAATIANISVYLTQIGWNGWGISPDIWTVVILLAGAVIACAAAVIGKDPIAALAVMWAYLGILIRHISPAYYAGEHPYVIAAAIVCEMLILFVILYRRLNQWCRGRKYLSCR